MFSFPERLTTDGKVVSSVDELCDYLVAKDASIQRDVLDFEGRNTVIYKLWES